eukprot:TRINITY_DN6458_c0_g1_i4.p1 TRINITY_DN6458_c0_g1~~TRINITY_DN6458_c0_g1_i4.p1  ORF type:complete len:135 (+),score=38.70 TRINITY_DN6458_c0_g1_i4:112-516(+)
MQRGLVGSEMCIRDRVSTQSTWGTKLGSYFSIVVLVISGLTVENPLFSTREIGKCYTLISYLFIIAIIDSAMDRKEVECQKEDKKTDSDYVHLKSCLLYTSDAADDTPCVDLGGRRIIKKKKEEDNKAITHLTQ